MGTNFCILLLVLGIKESIQIFVPTLYYGPRWLPSYRGQWCHIITLYLPSVYISFLFQFVFESRSGEKLKSMRSVGPFYLNPIKQQIEHFYQNLMLLTADMELFTTDIGSFIAFSAICFAPEVEKYYEAWWWCQRWQRFQGRIREKSRLGHSHGYKVRKETLKLIFIIYKSTKTYIKISSALF